MSWRAMTMLLLATGCMSPVVGAECRPGLTACNGRCVDLAYDPQSCGACGSACTAGESCLAGQCTAAGSDAGWPEGDAALGWPADAGARMPPGTSPERERGLHAPPLLLRACALGELACDEGCVSADRDPAHCGACDHACGSGESCVEGACIAACEAPLAECGGECVDPRRDPDHCGACGVSCDAGVCVDGACELALAGHLVVIGHDYETRRPGMSRLVGNAALLPSRPSVRVLAYEGASRAESRAGAIAAIDASARDAGRTWVHEPVRAELLSYRLASADVLLVHAQSELAPDDAAALGGAWELALRSFLSRGGTLVALVSADARDGTLAILEAAGLLDPITQAPAEITGSFVSVVRSSDAVAVGVPLTYRAERSTVRLPLDLELAVVSDGVGPVVFHRAMAPPE